MTFCPSLSVGFAQISTDDPLGFYQNSLGDNLSPLSVFCDIVPGLCLDSFVTIGVLEDNGSDGTATDPSFNSCAFNCLTSPPCTPGPESTPADCGNLVGGWFNANPANGQLRRDIRVPFGVNILWDAIASLALARATGAGFIREVLTGVYESDLGMIEPRIGEIAGYRSAIGSDHVALFDNVAPEFSSAIGSRSVADRARGAAFLGMDAVLISGPAAGVAFEGAARRKLDEFVAVTQRLAA